MRVVNITQFSKLDYNNSKRFIEGKGNIKILYLRILTLSF